MQKKAKIAKRALIVFLVLLALVIASCKGGTDRRDRPSGGYDYRTGIQGLSMDFPVNTPTELYENDQNVQFIVEIKNKGAYPSPNDLENGRMLNGKLWVGGFDKNIIELAPEQDVLDDDALQGKSESLIDGGYSAISIKGQAHSLPEGSQIYEPTIIVTATYDYKTIASPEVCIDPSPRSTQVREKVCRIDNYKTLAIGSSQGAPVAITRVEESISAKNILFKIYVKNVGDGIVIMPDHVDKNPNQGYDWDEIDQVRLEDVSIGTRKATECTPSIGSYVRLLNKEGYIFCKLSTAGINDVYISALSIKLGYSYANSIQRKISVYEENI